MSQQYMSTTDTVSIAAPARLHMGFLDLNGGLHRRFGSIGVGIKGLSTDLSVRHNPRLSVTGADDQRILETVSSLLDYFSINTGIEVNIQQQIPSHQGLGSGTQMALALGIAMSKLFGIDASIEQIAIATGRGKRSGIGIGVFKYGGFIVDSGRTEQQAVPSIISHLHFPEDWRFVLVFDESAEGISGPAELSAFASLPDITDSLAAEVCRLVLMQTLPGVIEKDCEQFGGSISRIQEIYGEYFKPAQGGLYTSHRVEQAVEFLLDNGATGGGQTSWGPTGFAIFPDKATAQLAVTKFSEQNGTDNAVKLQLTSAENSKSRIQIEHSKSAVSTLN